VIDSLTRLRFATAATRHGGGAIKLTAKVRRDGVDEFETILRALTGEQLDAVDETVDRLHGQGISALLVTDDGYPPLLAANRTAPAALFVRGPESLLHRPGIGACGSRNATDESLQAARACGEVVAAHGFSLVSGYARGVDMATHIGALAQGGTTTIVLAEGIEHFRIRRGEFADRWDLSRCVVVSQFSPTQPWSAGNAMTRNAVISGLSRALVVVEAGETGGTLAAGLHALDRGQPVLVLQLSGVRDGNQILLDKGATPVRSRRELELRLADLPANGSAQLSLI
jgi:DNA processing protein